MANWTRQRPVQLAFDKNQGCFSKILALLNLQRWAPNVMGGQSWLAEDFSNSPFERIGTSQLIEEEILPPTNLSGRTSSSS